MMSGEGGSGVLDELEQEDRNRERLLKIKERRDAIKAAGRTPKPKSEGETAMGRPKGSKNTKTAEEIRAEVDGPAPKRRGRKPKKFGETSMRLSAGLVTIEEVSEAFDRAMELFNTYRSQKAERIARLAEAAA